MKYFLVLASFLTACGHTSLVYKFTCPDKTIVKMIVTKQELENQGDLYDRVVKECYKKRKDEF